jgi:hypothetical protein
MASKANGIRQRVPWRMLAWGAAAAVVVAPAIAMQFTQEVNWTAFDFGFAIAMVLLVGGTFELAVRRSGNRYYRSGVAVALATAFLLVWINGAVGIIGDEGNAANLLFLGVIALAIGGSVVARFEAPGMARAMTVAAAAEAMLGLVVLIRGLGANEPPGLAGVLLLIGVFALMWLVSAWLFRRAAA